MEVKRRAFLGTVAALAMAVADAQAAHAMLFSGAGSGGGGGSGNIGTLSMRNASGSSETPMWSKEFGLGFPDSDTTGCPLSGGNPTYPEFKSGSNVLGYSMSTAPTFHPSGRLAHAMFVLVYGTVLTVANGASGSIAVNQTNNTSRPTNSSRALSDFSTADLKHLVTGLDNVSGNYSATLNDGITDALSDNYVWLDGAAGKLWRIRARYKQAGTAEGNLEAYIYPMAMQNASGGFGGIRFLWDIASPYGDATLAKRDWKTFSAMTLQTGATVIRDNVTANRNNVSNFTWSSGTDMISAGNVFETAQTIRLTTTGTLPTGLATGTTYWVYTDAYYTPPYSTFKIEAGGPFDQGTSYVTPSGAGSGTHTATAYPWLPCYSRLSMCGTTADFDFVQGGGSFTPVTTYVDTNLQTVFTPSYWRSTKMIPSYDFTPVASVGTAVTYQLNGTCGLHKLPGSSGINDDHVGIISGYYARHLYTQSLIDERNCKAIALASGAYGTEIRVLAGGGTYPAWNKGHSGSGTPYTGMGTLLYDKIYYPPGGSNIYQPNSTIAYYHPMGPLNRGGQTGDYTHRMQYCQYTYLITGRPDIMDRMLGQASTASASGYNPGTVTAIVNGTQYAPAGGNGSGSVQGSRNVTDTLGTTRYNVETMGGQARGTAWLRALTGFLAFFLPAAHPEQSAAYKAYWTDICDDGDAHAVSIASAMFALNSYASTNKFWHAQFGSPIEDPWQNAGYYLMTMATEYGYRPTTNSATLIQWTLDHWAYIINTFGINMLGAFETMFLGDNGGGAGTGWPITAATQWGVVGAVITAWSNGSANFTIDISGLGGWVAPVGDRVVFINGTIASHTTTPIPGAFSGFTGYYIVSSSGSGTTRTIQLSATPGGSAINNNDNKTTDIQVAWCPSSPMNTLGFSNGPATQVNYLTRSVYLAKSRGFTINAALETALDANVLAATTGNFASDPSFCFGKTA